MSADRSFARYNAMFFVALASILTIAWIYGLTMPLYYQESGYSVWLAKFNLIRACNLGNAVLFGDSRAQAAFLPRDFGEDATNLSFGAATPIELFVTATNTLSCKNVPARVMVSFPGVDFMRVSPFFWENGVRYGFFTAANVWNVRNVGAQLADDSAAMVETRFGTGLSRDLIYSLRLPSIYFNNLVSSRLFLRYKTNTRMLHQAEQDRGFLAFPFRGGLDKPGREAEYSEFRPLPIQDYFFHKFLDLATARGVDVDYVAAPLSKATLSRVTPLYKRELMDYLEGLTSHYPRFHIRTPLFFEAPASMFSDPEHLGADGAAWFTRGLAKCLRLTMCDQSAWDGIEFQ